MYLLVSYMPHFLSPRLNHCEKSQYEEKTNYENIYIIFSAHISLIYAEFKYVFPV
jgi:hypothetical protein